MNRIFQKVYLFGFALMLIGISRIQVLAQPLATYGFTGNDNSADFWPADAQPSNATMSNFYRGPGVNKPANPGTIGAFTSSVWTMSPTKDDGDYYQFSVKPMAGFSFRLDSVVLDELRSNTGITKWATHTSRDNYATAVQEFIVPDVNTFRNNQKTVFSGASFNNITDSIGIRFYGYAAESEAGTWRMDNVRVYGVISNGGNPTPVVMIVPSNVVFGNVTVGTSAIKSVRVSGNNLTGNVSVVASGVQISSDSANFVATSPIVLTATSGSVAATKVFVRVSPATVGAITGTVTASTTGASNAVANVSANGVTNTNPVNPLYRTIGSLRGVNAQGVADSLTRPVIVTGTVHSINYRVSPAIEFAMMDYTGGINVFRISALNPAYTVTEGDSIRLRGTVSQFRGLIQLAPDSIKLIAAGRPLMPAQIVTALNESTEGRLVKVENVTLTSNSPWGNATSYTAKALRTGSTDTVYIRVVLPATGINIPRPTGVFKITGIGYQFASTTTAPFVGGYQINPRRTSDIETGTVVNPTVNNLYRTIGSLRGVNAQGVADSLTRPVIVTGTVHSINYRVSPAIEFTMMDYTGGINVFRASALNPAYTVTEGDSIRIRGTVSQFRGLIQLAPDSIKLIAAGRPLMPAQIVMALNESTEGRLVKMENVTLTSNSAWGNATSYTAKVLKTGSTDTVYIRVVLPATGINIPRPTGVFKITGIGYQFASTAVAPFVGGYQINPRRNSDIETGTVVNPTANPLYRTIGSLRGVNTQGVADSLTRPVIVTGTVHSINYRVSPAIEFTMMDYTGGINVFRASALNPAYTVTEGDSIRVRGTVSQFRGLIQVAPDSIKLIAAGRPLMPAQIVTALNESTEGRLVKMENVTLTSNSAWGNATSYTAKVLKTGSTDTVYIRVVLPATGINIPRPTGVFKITGIGYQFASTAVAPFVGGYQINPRRNSDIETGTVVNPTVNNLYRTIGSLRGVNATTGIADSLNKTVIVTGTVHSVNFRPTPGLEFTIRDYTGSLHVMNKTANVNPAYTVVEGDSIRVRGLVSQDRGLLHIFPDSIKLIAANRTSYAPVVVTTLTEATEGVLVKMENLKLTSNSPWGGNNITAKAFVGTSTDTTFIRLDSEALITVARPAGVFKVTGIGYQFDLTAPLTAGYQINPRRNSDIEVGTVNPGVNNLYRTIGSLRGVNAQGVADSLTRPVIVTGTVHSINYRPAGLEFTMMDYTGGINVFRASALNPAYTVTEGDSIRVRGTVSQFRGLIQLAPDSIKLIAAGRPLMPAQIVTALNESTEGRLVKMENVTLTSNSVWGNATSYTAKALRTGSTDTIYIRVVLPATGINIPRPTGEFKITGIGYQFASTTVAPFVGGYQINPRRNSDIELTPNNNPTVLAQPLVNMGQVLVGNSAIRGLRLGGTNLTADIVVTPKANVEISQDSANFVSVASINFAPVAGIVTEKRIFVRVQPTSVGIKNDTVMSMSTGANTFKTVIRTNAIDGTVVLPSLYRTIGSLRGVNTTTGIADSLNKTVIVTGTVHSVNFRPTPGLEFTIRDYTGSLHVMNKTANVNPAYTVVEGDSIRVRGLVSQDRGLLHIFPDSIKLIAANRTSYAPVVVTTLTEATEGVLVKMENLKLTSNSPWGGNNITAKAFVGTSTDTTFIRLDSEALITVARPTGVFNVTGIGYQFDLTAPLTGGYQINPRRNSDIDVVVSVKPTIEEKLVVFPNPAKDQITVATGSNETQQLSVINTVGQTVINNRNITGTAVISLEGLNAGLYIVKVVSADGKTSQIRRLVVTR